MLEIVYCPNTKGDVVKGTSKEKKNLKARMKRKGIGYSGTSVCWLNNGTCCGCINIDKWPLDSKCPHEVKKAELITFGRCQQIQIEIDKMRVSK